MHVNIIIPTIFRNELLAKTIRSIGNSQYKDFSIIVVVDNNNEDLARFAQKLGVRKVILNRKRLGWPRSVNVGCQSVKEGAVFYASDDLIFDPQCIGNAVKALKNKFPDGDGLIGIYQNLTKFCPAAFGLCGYKFINRFPDSQLMNPAYIHYCGDSELWRYAKKHDRFYLCESAKVIHIRLKDQTKRLAHKTLLRDRKIWWARKDRKSYWGDDFNIGDENVT